MVLEVIRYAITVGDEAIFEDAYRRVAPMLESASQCLGYTLTRATRQRNRYMMIIYWDSPDGHLIGFRESPLFKDFQETMAPFAGQIEEAGHYRKTGIELTKKQLVRDLGPAAVRGVVDCLDRDRPPSESVDSSMRDRRFISPAPH